jgi:plastocyanin
VGWTGLRITAMLAGLVLPSAPGMAEEFPITMAGMAYAPPTIAAKVGDTLVLTNDDATDHNVFVATVGHAVDLGTQKPGETRQLALGKVGRFEIECVIHPDMKAVVEVQQ